MKLKRFEYAVAVAVLALVAGCGGGGGSGGDGGGTTTPPTGTTPATDFTLGGTVTGLRAGAAVTLANGGESLPVSANGAFSFPTKLKTGAAYNITVTPPAGYTCKATAASGTVASANINSNVDCAPTVLAGVRGSLQAPLAVAGDGQGNLYVTDGSQHGVLRLASNGQLGVVAGGTGQPGLANGAGAAARFWLNSSGAAVDAQGNIFVADSCNGAIRKMTASGEVSTLTGNGSTSCYNVADPAGAVQRDGPAATARFVAPQSLASDGAGGVLVIDKNAGLKISRVAADGTVTTTTYANNSGTPVTQLQTIARAADGTVYVSDESDRIWKVVGTTIVLHAGSLVGQTSVNGTGADARFAAITSMVAVPNGDLYVTDFASVRKVTSAGVVTTLAGSAARGDLDAVGTAAQFGNLLSIGFDGKNLFVVDSGQEVLRKITIDGSAPEGTVTTVAATPAVRKTINGDANTARFGSFSSVAADADGNMYFADPVTHVVRKATPDGTVTTLAGALNTAALPGQGDGPVATSRFAAPTRVATGKDGSIWVAQSLGLRRIKDGAVTTVDASVRPIGLAVDADGNAIVTTGVVSGEVLRITPAGVKTVLVTKAQIVAASGRADATVIPQSVAVDGAGNIYFADTGTVAVYKRTPAGDVTVFAGTPFKETGNIDGGVNTATLGFYEVDHMTVDDGGNLYLSGSGNVRKISPAGVVSTPSFVWGNASIGAITWNKGKLIGMTRYAALQQYL